MAACLRPSDATGARPALPGARVARGPGWRVRSARRVWSAITAAALAALTAAGCSPQRLVVVESDPCVVGDASVCVAVGLLDGVVGYWRLDDGAGSASARDSSGRGNNGVLIGLNWGNVWGPGRSGTGLAINAAGWVSVAPSASIDSITDRLTMAGWIYFDGVVMDYATLLSREIGSTIQQHYHLSINSEARPNLFITGANGGTIVTAPSPVVPRTWVHLAATYDGALARLYVNGALVPTSPGAGAVSGTFAADTTPLVIGGNGNDATGVPTELFSGRIDEVMLYRRALSADEIGRIFAGELFASSSPRSDAAAD
jgi:hypothetical protein